MPQAVLAAEQEQECPVLVQVLLAEDELSVRGRLVKDNEDSNSNICDRRLEPESCRSFGRLLHVLSTEHAGKTVA